MKSPKIFAAYKGDELLGIGTKKELAELLEIPLREIYRCATPHHRKSLKEDHNALIVIKVEESED